MADRALHGLAFGFLLVGFVSFTVAFGWPHWFKSEIAGANIHLGLWQICGLSKNGVGCITYQKLDLGFSEPRWLIAAQVLETLALGLAVLALILSMGMFRFPHSARTTIFVGASLLAAAIIGAVGAVTFIAKQSSNATTILALTQTDTAFYLNFVGYILFIVAGGLHILMSRFIYTPQGGYRGL